ncbi:MAG: hypothetical protein K2K80_03735 [Clostridia bacterium]|nr:hypothetical protein [Clostridia bacterium]
MKKGECFARNFNGYDNFLECGDCGNHICKTQAEVLHGLCPHCFGKLYRMN